MAEETAKKTHDEIVAAGGHASSLWAPWAIYFDATHPNRLAIAESILNILLLPVPFELVEIEEGDQKGWVAFYQFGPPHQEGDPMTPEDSARAWGLSRLLLIVTRYRDVTNQPPPVEANMMLAGGASE
jgi:hypothetical protein